MCRGTTEGYGHAASNLVAGSALEQTVQQIIDMGGGTWDRDTVLRALRAAFNNPERAVEYLYSVSILLWICSHLDLKQLSIISENELYIKDLC